MKPVDILGSIITSSIVSQPLPSKPSSFSNTNTNTNNSNSSNQNNHNEQIDSPQQSNGNLEKEPLSIQTTTINFRNFVSKSGPIFAFQDTVEAIVIWKEPVKTIFWGCVWAFLCLYPLLFLLLPNIGLISILISTYSIRFPDDGSGEVSDVRTEDGLNRSNEPIEGSVDYLSNMQNIQILMGRISEGSDFIKENVVPYLDWSNPGISIVILHLAFISSVLIAMIFPLIQWRFVFLIIGESVLLTNHPRIQQLIFQLRSLAIERALDRKILSRLQRTIANDALTDEVIDSPKIIEVCCFEHERYAEGAWSKSNLSSGDPSPWARELAHHEHVPVPGLRSVTPPSGFQWITGEGWEVRYHSEEGLTNRAEKGGWFSVNPELFGHSVRRRRWIRRAFQRSD